MSRILHGCLPSFSWPPAAFNTVSAHGSWHHQYSARLFSSCRFSQRSPQGISGEPQPTWDLLVPLTPVSLRLTPLTLWITLRCLQVKSESASIVRYWQAATTSQHAVGFWKQRKPSREWIKTTSKIIFIWTSLGTFTVWLTIDCQAERYT